jgi:hypothetical protein
MTNAIAKTQSAEVAQINNSRYIAELLDNLKQDFMAVNEGMDFDFVRLGTFLMISKMGKFVERDSNKDVIMDYGDSIDVVNAKGEKRWTVWGEPESEEEGQLIVAEQDKTVAEEKLQEWLNEKPDRQCRYSLESLELRYMAWIVPVETITSDGFPKIYTMSFPKTSTYSFGRYAESLYFGKAAAAGVPKRTPVNCVVTRMTTSEKSDKVNSWIGIDFSAVGLFNPADYGIGEGAEAQPQEAF